MDDQFSTFVYTKHENKLAVGKIIDIGNGKLTVEILNSTCTVEVNYNEVYPTEADQEKDVDDHCALMYLNEVTLLQNCKRRYQRKLIYTYLAHILVSVNPYEVITDLYSLDNIRNYKNKSLGVLPPHVFAIADKAHRDMRRLNCSQAIVISGESGAGKTESQKHILRFYCENFGQLGIIEQRILEANPILEAFGNAKTTRNSNSSRFGKFVELHFDSKFDVCGGFVEHYLLEKSRIISSNLKERNYHIFYYLLASQELHDDLHIYGSVQNFQYLKSGDSLSDEDIIIFKKQLENLIQALDRIGFSSKQRNDIFKVIAGILHLGNVNFEETNVNAREGCEISNASEQSLDYAAELLGLDSDELSINLTTRIMTTTKRGGGTVYSICLKPSEAENSKNSLTKAIYSRLFDEIVAAINRSIPFGDSVNYIGILDIAGFEYFEVNSFEQFCINYANEKMQHFFNERILKNEQQIYSEDSLEVGQVLYSDNLDCIELFESTNGLLNILDEESRLPKPTHNHFTETVHARLKNHPRLLVPRKSARKENRSLRDSDGFVVQHYADEVTYQSAQFLGKNHDTLHDSLFNLMHHTSNDLLKSLFTSNENSMPNKPSSTNLFKSRSVSHKFRSQLNLLLKKLRETQTHFVRCFKPNQDQVPENFEEFFVLKQLNAAGMPSVLSLMQAGYPSRLVFNELYAKYKPYISEIKELQRLDPRIFCQCLFKSLGFNDCDYKFGLTKVFFRAGKFAAFDQLLKQDQSSIQEFVSKTRSWLIQMRFKKVAWSVLAAIKIKNRIQFRVATIRRIQNWIKCTTVQNRITEKLMIIRKVILIQNGENELREVVSKLHKENQAIWTEKITDFIKRLDDFLDDIKKNVELADPSLLLKFQQFQIEFDKHLDDLKNQAEEDEKRRILELEARIQAVKVREEAEKKSKLEAERIREEQRKIEEKRRQDEEEKGRQEALAEEEARQKEDVQDTPNTLTTLKYGELRKIINTSLDKELVKACRLECHRRMRGYLAWKQKSMSKKGA